MTGLDFRRASDLFMGSADELARALGIGAERVERYRKRPREVPPELLERLGDVLIERGRGMVRVGEMLVDEAGAE
ncbi:MAG: hypothetical protein ACODAE_03315 [Gemmatimonadota bacterium]